MRRRTFLASSAAGAAAWLAGCARRGPAASGPAAAALAPGAAAPGALVFVGTYTENTQSRGVYAFRADARTGAWTPLGATDVGPNPSYLAVHPNGRVLYAVNEVTSFGGAPSGAVRAFAVDRATGALAPLGEPVATGGGAPCYVAVDATGRLLMVANYVGGSVAAFPLAADGRRGRGRSSTSTRGAARAPTARSGRTRTASSPTRRTGGPCPRTSAPTSSRCTRSTRARRRSRRRRARRCAPGRGRATSRSTRRGARCTRSASSISRSTRSRSTRPRARSARRSRRRSSPPPRPTAAPPPTSTVHPSGRALYASVRGDDSVARFALDAAGRPTFAERVSTGGRRPRNFALDPAGRFLYAANQGSDAVVVFGVDPADGRLTPTGARVEVPAPVCVRFA
jgi:6-phosphogluconolactonase